MDEIEELKSRVARLEENESVFLDAFDLFSKQMSDLEKEVARLKSRKLGTSYSFDEPEAAAPRPGIPTLQPVEAKPIGVPIPAHIHKLVNQSRRD